MADEAIQDAQIFKERCEDSPGIVVLCQGDWRPTPERIRLLESQNYYVLTAANGYQDITDWLPQPRCMGAMFGHPETVGAARQQYPDKIVERFEGVGARFLRSLTQELPNSLHNAGLPFAATAPRALKTVDVVSVFSPVALKRGHLLMEALIASGASAYVFSQSLGANPELFDSFRQVVDLHGKSIEYFHYPFDPYALIRIDGRIIIDGRPIGANNSLVSAYLARARLYVHTSMTEGISNSIMEALLNDVPVLLCEDIRGPQQNLSLQLPSCIFRSPPEAGALAGRIREIAARDFPYGSIREAFRQVIDPFEINRKMVRATQEWFARQGLPWKGHCVGLLGGVQSRLDLGNVGAEETYRGGRHIYPNPAEAANYVAFQAAVAEGREEEKFKASLKAELSIIDPGHELVRSIDPTRLSPLPGVREGSPARDRICLVIPATPEEAHLLPELLLAVNQGTMLPDEVVIALSRGSAVPGETLAAIEAAFGKIADGTLLLLRKDQTPAALRNAACRAAKGEIVSLICPGEVPHPRRLEILSHFLADPEVLHISHGCAEAPQDEISRVSIADGTTLYALYFPNRDYRECSAGAYGAGLQLEHPIAADRPTFRRSVLEAVQWREGNEQMLDVAGDSEFCLEVLYRFRKSLVIDSPLVWRPVASC